MQYLALGGVAALSAIITAMTIFSTQGNSRRTNSKKLKDDVTSRSIPSTMLNTPTEEEELLKEQLSRNIAFLGEQGVNKVRGSFVIVVGMGGVGSWAATMLLRSGVGKFRVIDFDQVTLSSLNRHATAVRSTVGTPKVTSWKAFAREVNPNAQIEACNEIFNEEGAERLLSGNPDFVLDCIDNIETKIQLLTYCAKNNIKVARI